MRSKSPLGLKIAVWVGVAFLHIPLLLIIVYAFSAEDKSYVFPPPGLTTKWFAMARERNDVWRAIGLSGQVPYREPRIPGVRVIDVSRAWKE